jgi:predicted transcriptional regulator
MTPRLKDLLERAEDWPEADQEELVETARAIESRRTGMYVLDDREWSEIQQGIAEADRGEFVSDEDIAAADRRRGI